MNKAILKGRLGNNPENNKGAVKFSLATSEKWKDKKTGEMQERTEWHNVVFWGNVGKVVEKHLTKGSEVMVEGSINTQKWQDKQGNDRYTTQIVGSSFEFCGVKPEGSSDPVSNDDSNQQAEKSVDIPF